MKRVICRSGIEGWQCDLRENYSSFDEFEDYCGIYYIHMLLGYKTPEDAWGDNPTVRGSTNPSDFEKVK